MQAIEDRPGSWPTMTAAIDQGYGHRLRSALGWPAFGVVVFLAWLVSTQVLFQPHLFEMWELPDIARGWAYYFCEVSLIGVLMWLAVVAAEQYRLSTALARGALLATAAYSTPSRTAFHADGGQHSAVMADTVPR
jgi:uncharacterized membrane protein